MNYLFFIVHPSKYHMFRFAVNRLKAEGHKVDIVIVKKGILEELIKSEGWEYINIFPGGRNIPGLGKLLSTIINIPVTLYKLFKITNRSKYDLLITDDLLTIIGRIKGIPSILCTDDDLRAVPESFFLMAGANYILAPSVADMGKYNRKKIGYKGIKALAHLHPARFIPDKNKLPVSLKNGNYFFIRLVSVNSVHDIGNKGINNKLLADLVTILERHGTVVINSEREVPAGFNKYIMKINPPDIAHYIAFARLFISDSTTMCAEAAVLGTGAVEINDWFDDFEQYKLLHNEYGLITGIKPDNAEQIPSIISKLIKNENGAESNKQNRDRLIKNSADLSEFIYTILSEFPTAIEKYFNSLKR